MLNGEDLQRPTYTCLRTIQEGSASICRKGMHEIFGKTVVQKTISLLGTPDGVAHEPGLLETFDHPHIVKVREAQFDPELRDVKGVTFVCDYYEGGSVLDAMREGHVFDIDTTVVIACQVLDALAYLHGQTGYLHRDVKPGNILLDARRTRGCLGDLGSAALADDSGYAKNNGGTPLYLDPAAIPTGRVSAQSDLYGLGVSMVEMLVGRFQYETIDTDDLFDRLATGKRALPNSAYDLAPETPLAVAKIVRNLVHPDPAKRPKSAAEALRSLSSSRFISWNRKAGSGLTGEWEGSWPRHSPSARGYRVTVAKATQGARLGQASVTVFQRTSGGKWRRINELCSYIPSDDSNSLKGLFRKVERHAQA